MNDFNKEELEEIKRCLKYIIKGGTTPYSTFTIDLSKKIQSMIESYSFINIPTMKDYICDKCNEEWRNCGCKDE